MHTNKVTKSLLEMMGDITPTGYQLDGVPILLNKDDTTQFPQIRVTPFIDKFDIDNQKFMEKTLIKYRQYEGGVFQIDIFSRNVIQCQNLYDTLVERLYDFFNLETVIYNWSPNFKEIDNNTYKNIDYALTGELFKDIYSVTVCGKKLKRSFCFEDLEMDSWFVDKDALYVMTKMNLKTVDIKVLLQGRLFENGDAYSDRGIHYHERSKQRNLSALENNEVERITFELFILYSHTREREAIPKAKRVKYPKIKVR